MRTSKYAIVFTKICVNSSSPKKEKLSFRVSGKLDLPETKGKNLNLGAIFKRQLS